MEWCAGWGIVRAVGVLCAPVFVLMLAVGLGMALKDVRMARKAHQDTHPLLGVQGRQADLGVCDGESSCDGD